MLVLTMNMKKIKKKQKNIETGYYQQAIVHMMKIMPKKNKQITPSQAKEILNIYKEYLDILLPNFLTINLQEF